MPIKNQPSSGNNEWETPPEIFAHWDGLFGFDCDVAASPQNTKVTAAYFTKEDSALTRPWYNRNWMNPPFGRGLILPFFRKASEEAKEGRLTVGLLPVSPAPQWWQQYVTKADYIYFYPKRINFLRVGMVIKGAAFDPCIAIWGLNP